jgi:F0F1-type ATP synthase assembly protein I
MNKFEKIQKLSRKLKLSERMFAVMMVFMALGILSTIASTFIWVWVGWALAWRIGATGLLVFFLSGIGWAVIYNLMRSTINHINQMKNESNH